MNSRTWPDIAMAADHRSGPTGASEIADPDAFKVNVEALRRFADQLTSQIEVLRKAASALGDPTNKDVRFGDFPEATRLAWRHAAALDGMLALLEKVKAAIEFADRVTDAAATYDADDHQAAGSIRMSQSPWQ